jgi:hypothetical protein
MTYGLIGWKGTHEELQAFLDDPDEVYGSPEDWYRNHPLGANWMLPKPPEEKS